MGPTAALSKSSTLTKVLSSERAGIVCMRCGSERDAGTQKAASPEGCKVFLLPDQIKRDKGVWWMPWQQEAMKDVIPCDKPWGAGNRL